MLSGGSRAARRPWGGGGAAFWHALSAVAPSHARSADVGATERAGLSSLSAIARHRHSPSSGADPHTTAQAREVVRPGQEREFLVVDDRKDEVLLSMSAKEVRG